MDREKRDTGRYQKAYQIAQKAHAGQLDKGGNPYIEHPLAVADMVIAPNAKIVALLHDVVEDGGVSLESLSDFGSDIVDAVDAITQRDGEKREDYLNRVKSSEIARCVKIADLTHNSDLSRIADPSEADAQRRARYFDEIFVLRGL